jgi:hypothetical protein
MSSFYGTVEPLADDERINRRRERQRASLHQSIIDAAINSDPQNPTGSGKLKTVLSSLVLTDFVVCGRWPALESILATNEHEYS